MPFNNISNPAPSEYTQITTATTTTIGPGIVAFEGYTVVTGVAGSVTIYDNSAASGTLLVNAASTGAAGNLQNPCPTDGLQPKSGFLTIVTSAAATLNIFYARQIP